MTLVRKYALDVPQSWYTRMCAWINRYAVSGIVATERGARNNKLHLQGVFSVRLSPPTA